MFITAFTKGHTSLSYVKESIKVEAIFPFCTEKWSPFSRWETEIVSWCQRRQLYCAL